MSTILAFDDINHKIIDMLYSITVENPETAPFKYMASLKAFESGRTFEFSPGVNIIAGPNGSGKSTLMNIVAAFAFCERSGESEIPDDVLKWPNLFNYDESGVKDGVKVKMDWCGKVFRYMPVSDMPYGAEEDSVDNFGQYLIGARSSTGEKTVQGIEAMFKRMFNASDYSFPINALKAKAARANSVWKERIKSLLEYYGDNQTVPAETDFEYTVLMDEPDRNLDIENSKEILGILSARKEMTQIVAVVHNPALLYRLSKNKDINFVEMEPGYIDAVKKFIEG